MRFLSGLGAALFAYLTLIPAGLIGSTIDSSCAGAGCESSVLVRIGFTLAYALCAVALLVVAAALAHNAVRGTAETQERAQRSLALAAVIVGVATFGLLTLSFPVGGGVLFVIAAAIYLSLRCYGRTPKRPDPSTNGHSPNGRPIL